MNFNDQGLFGFDVSLYQRYVDLERVPPLVKEIDFVKMKAYGTDFVIMKAGQYNYTDPGFVYNWRASKEAGIARGSYWFLDSRDSGRNQAIRYWNLLKNDLGEGIHAADFEWGATPTLDFLYTFVNEFQQLSGLPNERIAIYSTYYYFNDAQATSQAQRQWFGRFPLWLAWYASTPAPVLVPSPWSQIPEQPILWQEGTPSIGLEVGVWSQEVDKNRLNGGADKLATYFGAIPNEGEEMDYYEVRSTNTSEFRTVRSGPRVTFTQVATFPAGANTLGKARVDDVKTYTADEFDGTTIRAKAGDSWVHLYEINGTAVNGWIAVKHLGAAFTTLRLVQTTPPVEEYIIHVRGGVSRKFIPEV